MTAIQWAGVVILAWGAACFCFAWLTCDSPKYWFKR